MATTGSILIVDDEDVVREVLTRHLTSLGYSCVGAADAAQARTCLKANSFDLVLLDIRLPDESGMDLLDFILASAPETAVVMVTAQDDLNLAIQSFKKGAYAYILKPFHLDDLTIQVANAFHRRKLELENRAYETRLEDMVEERTKELVGALRHLERNYDRTIQSLCAASGIRHVEEQNHCSRVAEVTLSIGRALKVGREELKEIERGAYLHDIGMIGIPDRILLKPGPLEEDEWALVRKHPQTGFDIIRKVDFLQEAAKVVLSHHERYDGKGYPRGLAGEEIPLGARLFSVADALDAMVRSRPYSEAHSYSVATEDIAVSAGAQLDRDVVRTFLRISKEVHSSIYPHVKD